MFCSKCGKEVAAELRFCGWCGATLTYPQTVYAPPQQELPLPPPTEAPSIPSGMEPPLNPAYAASPQTDMAALINMITATILSLLAGLLKTCYYHRDYMFNTDDWLGIDFRSWNLIINVIFPMISIWFILSGLFCIMRNYEKKRRIYEKEPVRCPQSIGAVSVLTLIFSFIGLCFVIWLFSIFHLIGSNYFSFFFAAAFYQFFWACFVLSAFNCFLQRELSRKKFRN